MDRRLVSGLIAILTTGFLGQAIATDRAPLVAPVIEMVADVGPRAEDGTYTIRTDQVVVDPRNEVTIDLHVVRSQFGPAAQAGIAGTEVVYGDLEAHGPVVANRHANQFVVVQRILL